MNIAEKLRKSSSPLFTFELLPPIKGKGINALYEAIEPLLDFDPAYINVTCHASDVVYKETPSGLMEKRVVCKRPGTVATAAAIRSRYNVEVVPHLICRGYSQEEIENILIDLHFLNINNILALRGDPPRGLRSFVPAEHGHANTSDLMGQIARMNEGKYLDEGMKKSIKTNFSMGVAGYPEKHAESPNMASDIHFLKKKVAAGAEYIVTQMFFDNQKYIDFVKKCREEGITIPIVPGIKPIASLNDIKVIPQIFSIDMPEELVKELIKCKTREHAREVGVEWAIHQSKGLMEFGVPSLHYYTLGESDNIKKICQSVF